RADAVLVVQVDVVYAEALQRGFARLTYVLGITPDAQESTGLVAHVAELGGEHHAVPPVPNGAPHEPLVLEGAIHVGRVQKVDSKFQRPMDRSNGFLLTATGVEVAHPHA